MKSRSRQLFRRYPHWSHKERSCIQNKTFLMPTPIRFWQNQMVKGKNDKVRKSTSLYLNISSNIQNQYLINDIEELSMTLNVKNMLNLSLNRLFIRKYCVYLNFYHSHNHFKWLNEILLFLVLSLKPITVDLVVLSTNVCAGAFCKPICLRQTCAIQ